MTDLPKFKDCPFCGHMAVPVEGAGKWYIACCSLKCSAVMGEGYDRDAMPDHSFDTVEDAAAAWNARHISMSDAEKSAAWAAVIAAGVILLRNTNQNPETFALGWERGVNAVVRTFRSLAKPQS